MMKYTKVHREWILRNYKGKGPKQTANEFNKVFGTNVSHKAMKSYFGNHKLNSGVDGYFPKGNVPMNKGKKQTDYMTPEAIERTKATRYKKGNISPNNAPIGTERVTRDGYIEVKIQDGKLNKNWKLKHRLNWESANGEIPPGYRLIFLDGNRQNCTVKNLKIVPLAISGIMNKKGLYIKGNVELNTTGILIAELIHTTNERLKNEKKT